MDKARQVEFTIYALLLTGIIFIYNSSIIHSQNVFGDPHRFIVLHLGWVFISLVVFKIFSILNFKLLLNIAPILYIGIGILLLFLALVGILPCDMSIAFAPCINSANRWLVLNPQPLPQIPFIGELSFQPSEAAKIAIILYLSHKLSTIKNSIKDNKAFKAYFIYTAIYSFLILLEPNMSTGLLIFTIGTVMYFVSGNSVKPFMYLVPSMLLLILLLAIVSPYRRERLLTFVNKDNVVSQTEEGYQVAQVKLALGSGGFFGVGFGNSRQKYTYLPEVSTDSIFAIIGEEFGFVGAILILFGFVFLLKKCFEIAKETSSVAARLCCMGIIGWIGTQIIIHLAANTGLIPYTGVPLPFISYGGSSMLFSMIGMGILVSISRTNA